MNNPRFKRRPGFTLVELLIVVAIAGIISGLAIFSFMGISRSLRLTSSAEVLNQSLLNARQQAITSVSVRRVAINITNGTFWTERKNVEARPFDALGGKNKVRSSEKQTLPKNVLIADIGGYTEDSLPGAENIWYFEFDSRGTAITYPSPNEYSRPASNPMVHNKTFTPRSNVAIHLILDSALFQLAENAPPQVYDLRNANFVNFISTIAGYADSGETSDHGNPTFTAEAAAAARKQVTTVFLLTRTGRTKVFDYGYGTPWSEIDAQEE